MGDWRPNGYASGAKPPPERKREHEQAHAVGQFQHGLAEAKRASEEHRVTRFITELWTWDLKAKRFRHAAGRKKLELGKGYVCIGGRFAKVGNSKQAKRIRERTEKKGS